MKLLIIPVLLLLTLASLGICRKSMAMEIKDDADSLRIPTAEITLIWEYYCMQHMARGEWHLARLNQKAIEFQRKDRLFFDTYPDQLTHFQKKLKEAQAAKDISPDSWGCSPPKVKLVFTELKVGPFDGIKNSESFISNTDNSVKILSTVLIDSTCRQPVLQWSISAPKYNIHKTEVTEVSTASEKREEVDEPPRGLSSDETVWSCTKKSEYVYKKRYCGYITYEAHPDSLNLMSKVETALAIPEAHFGDRGNDFNINVVANFSCNGVLFDKIGASFVQDEKDQLRQEYIDTQKKTIPKREELTNQGKTTHFSISEFNKSEKVNGGQYAYTLCKILDKLEQVRSHAGNIPMTINSGFRNPYKHHVILKLKTKESPHLYGFAADVSLEDFNKDGKINEEDRWLVKKPAKAIDACIEPAKNTKTWIHLDWRGTCPPGW